MNKHQIAREEILPMVEYEALRAQRRRDLAEAKRDRRVACGPDATFYFESYDTMWFQIHEMLYIEKGGEEQIPDELAAYNPLIPNGRELVATLMFEIENADRRARFLDGLGGVEETITLTLGDDVVRGVPEADVDRTNADGKASSVQFIHFPFNDEQVDKFRAASTQVVLGIDHEKYRHMTIFSETTRAALAADFD